MRWPGIETLYGPTLRQTPAFSSSSELGKKTGASAEGKDQDELESPGNARWEQLHKRVIEHVSSLVLCSTSCAHIIEPPRDRLILLANLDVPPH